MSAFLVNVRCLDEDAGRETIVHMITPDMDTAVQLVHEMVLDLEADPGDFAIGEVSDDFECEADHDSSDLRCGMSRLN